MTPVQNSVAGYHRQTPGRLISQQNLDYSRIQNFSAVIAYPFYFKRIGVWPDRDNDFQSETLPRIAAATRNCHAGFCNCSGFDSLLTVFAVREFFKIQWLDIN